MALARSAEEAGWDGLFLWDHMLAGPGVAVGDPWVTMAAIATATTRLRFGALVTPLPRRRPWVLARQIATLDRLSAGRLVAGIGVGDDGWSEFSSFGEAEDPVVRGEVLDEALDLLQNFLTGNEVHHHGRHFVVDTTALLPRPRQDPLPIWAACRWPHRKPLARAARLQGCFPIFPVDGPPPPPAPSDIAAIRSVLAEFGAPRILTSSCAVPSPWRTRPESRTRFRRSTTPASRGSWKGSVRVSHPPQSSSPSLEGVRPHSRHERSGEGAPPRQRDRGGPFQRRTHVSRPTIIPDSSCVSIATTIDGPVRYFSDFQWRKDRALDSGWWVGAVRRDREVERSGVLP